MKSLPRWARNLGFLVIGCFAFEVLFLPPMPRSLHGVRRSSCQSNLKQIGLAFSQYVQDYDEKFPIVGDTDFGWSQSLQPYLKSEQLFHCPSNNATPPSLVIGRILYGLVSSLLPPAPPPPKSTDYWFNSRLAAEDEYQVEAPRNTLLFGDGINDSASNYALSQLPQTWLNDQNSPAYRHLKGANYAFADGHVKWFKVKDVSTKSPEKSVATFAVK